MSAAHLHLIVNHSPLFAEMAALLLLAAGAALRKRDLVTAAFAAAVLAGPLAAAAFFSGRAAAEVIGRTEGVDQMAIAPGRLVKTWDDAGGRHHFEYAATPRIPGSTRHVSPFETKAPAL